MLQLTAARAADERLFGAPLLVGGHEYAEQLERQMREVDVPADLLILEPVMRNTAPAIALAALLAPAEQPMLVMPSDHLIRDETAFLEAVATALPAAADGYLVTFGIAPDRPATGYGYIRQGPPIAEGLYHVDCFIEKPNAAVAEEMLREGGHLWNGGIFLFRPNVYLKALEVHAPEILMACRRAIAEGERRGARFHPSKEAFAESPAIAVDYAIMEKADRVAVVPVEMGWSDVGSWDALYELGMKDGRGNVAAGNVIAVDTRSCLIRSDGPKVATVGLDDLIIVATADAILIMRRGESERVKEAVAALQGSV